MARKQTAQVVSDDDEMAAEAFADAIADMNAVEPSEMGAYLRTDLAETTVETPAQPKKKPSRKERDDALRAEAEEIARKQQEAREVSTQKAQPKPPAAPKEKKAKVGKPCECGCGELTGGGRFRPGHDATLKSRLFKEARGSDEAKSVAALEELDRRNWLHLMGAPKEKAVKVTMTPRQIIEQQLALLGLSEVGIAVIMDQIEEDLTPVTVEAVA